METALLEVMANERWQLRKFLFEWSLKKLNLIKKNLNILTPQKKKKRRKSVNI